MADDPELTYRHRREQINAIRRQLRTLDRLAVEICNHTMEINRRLHALEYGPELQPEERDMLRALQAMEHEADAG